MQGSNAALILQTGILEMISHGSVFSYAVLGILACFSILSLAIAFAATRTAAVGVAAVVVAGVSEIAVAGTLAGLPACAVETLFAATVAGLGLRTGFDALSKIDAGSAAAGGVLANNGGAVADTATHVDDEGTDSVAPEEMLNQGCYCVAGPPSNELQETHWMVDEIDWPQFREDIPVHQICSEDDQRLVRYLEDDPKLAEALALDLFDPIAPNSSL